MKIVLITLSVLSLNTFANVSGKWLGQGEWKYQGSGDHCYMTMNFEDGKNSLIRQSGNLDCSFVGLDVNELELKKNGSNLIDSNGVIVGSYQNDLITYTEQYSADVKIITTMKVDNLHMDYSEKWIDHNGAEIYDIEGRLFTSK